MFEHFGSFLADGDLGNRFRFCEIDQHLQNSTPIIFNFHGVENMSDSFANACFGALAEDHAQSFMSLVKFANCSNGIKQALSCAVSSGLRRGRVVPV